MYYFQLSQNNNEKKPAIPVIIGKDGVLMVKYFNTAQSENQVEQVMDCLKLNAKLPHVLFIEITIKLFNMDGYDLSRNFWNWAFENPEKIKPTHAAIYFFAVEHCNRLGWKNKFGFPSQMTMDAIGVSKYHTYIKYLNELVDFGFIKMVQKSKNQYSSNVISLMHALPKNDKALDKAFIKHGVKHSESEGKSNHESEGKSNHESEGSIIKQYNQEQLTINQYTNNKGFLNFLDQFENEVWFEQLAMNYSITLTKVQEIAKTFINDRKNDLSYEEKSLSELRTWFINYLKLNKDTANSNESPAERATRLINMAEAKKQKYKL